MKAVALLGVALVLAGCGGAGTHVRLVKPTLPRALASQLRTQSQQVEAALAAGDGCTAQAKAVALRTSVVEAINAHRVPRRFQETLLGTVNDIASRIVCNPAPAPPAPAPQGHGRGHDHERGHGHGHGHGHGNEKP